MPNQINNHYHLVQTTAHIVRAFVFHEEPLRPPCDPIRDRTKIKIKLTLFYNIFRSSIENFSKTTVHQRPLVTKNSNDGPIRW